MFEFLTKRFRKPRETDLDNRVSKSENLAPYSTLTGLNGLFNFDNKGSVYDLYANNEICRLGVDKLANDLSSLNYMIDGKDNADLDRLVEKINSREYKQMMVDLWKDYILDGVMIQTKSRGSATRELYFRRIIVKNSQVKANYEKGQIASIELALGVTEKTDINGMSNKLFMFGNRDPRESMLTYISPISAVLDELRRLKCARDWNNDLLARGGISPVLLSLADNATMSGGQIKEALTALEKAQTGNKGSSVGIIPLENMNVHVIGTTAKDLDFIEGQKQAVNNILLGMGIPPEVLGLNEKQAAMGTKLDAIQSYYNSTIIPNADRYAGMLSLWLNEFYKYDSTAVNAKPGDTESIPMKNKINLMVDKSSIPYAQDIQAKRMQDLEGITFLTDNEKREKFNLPPLTEAELPQDKPAETTDDA